MLNEERLRGLSEAGINPFIRPNVVSYTGDNGIKIPKEPTPVWQILLDKLPRSVEWCSIICDRELLMLDVNKLRITYVCRKGCDALIILRYDNKKNDLSLEDMLADALIDLHKQNLL